MAVIFGVPPLAPLGMMPNGQNVGGEEGPCSGFLQERLCGRHSASKRKRAVPEKASSQNTKAAPVGVGEDLHV